MSIDGTNHANADFRSRLSLMHTYAFAYYLETDANKRELFEGIQMDLALATEALSGYLERDLNKVKDPAKLKQEVLSAFPSLLKLPTC
jgi:hypothetical protein